ncbi:YcdB/YcdC domain-containing protein [Bacillus cereus]|uniref:YcdB/YcdC domain-containing protein n=1 Tax=Bacillus cereus TaxID=1396 RepID=UPI00356EFE18
MKKIIEQLKPYLKVNEHVELCAVALEDEENTFEIVEKRTDQSLACYGLNENGEIDYFQSYIELEEVEDNQLPHAEIYEKVQSFINTFTPRLVQSAFFSCIIEFDMMYHIVYEKKDERFGVFLPNSGFTIDLTKDGRLHQLFSHVEEYQINYSENPISKEEAKKKYIENLELELMISKVDKETFANGDDTYHLVYVPKDYVMDVAPDGELHTIESYGGFLQIYEKIEKRIVQNDMIRELVGLSDKHIKFHTNIVDKEVIEFWVRKERVQHIVQGEEEQPSQAIQVCLDKETGKYMSIVNNEQYKQNKEALTEEEARERALQFLFARYPDANERFMIEKSHPSHHLMWEEDEWEYVFYFQPMYNEVKVNMYSMTISVGKKSGIITRFHACGFYEKEIVGISIEPSISIEEAKASIINAVDLEFSWGKEIDKDMTSYHGCYMPAFPKTNGHVKMIEAQTGKAFYIDTGIIMEES